MMTQEEKQLLLKDLCARLPYRVKVMKQYKSETRTLASIDVVNFRVRFLENDVNSPFGVDIENPIKFFRQIKPYLRPMSSMTEEEKELLKKEHLKDENLYLDAINGDGSMRGKVILHYAADWCNKNHFDFRGLIPMGLALEAPKDMYNLK